ncbi:MAG: GNAT family N-acetyltransferase [Bacteroidetes bacterium]|nr:MAG: GNAT family N-acetyltransferase [Bacteroidota bacterium]
MLENKNIKLRALEASDLDLLYEWENNTDIWSISNTLSPFSKHILKQYLENSHLDIYQTKQLRLIIDLKKKENNIPIGTIDLFDFDPFHLRAGIGILIYSEENRNKGYATEALELLINYSFNYLGLHQLYCNIASDNMKSIKLFTKAGYDIVGEKKDWIKSNKGWINEYILQIINK